MTIITQYGYNDLSSRALQRLDRAPMLQNIERGRIELAVNGVLTVSGQVVTGKPYLAVYDEITQKKPSISVISTTHVNEAIRLYNDTVRPNPQLISTGAAILGALAIAQTALSFTRCVLGLQIGWEEIVASTGVIAGLLFVTLDTQGFRGANKEHAVAQTSEHSEKYCKAAAKLAIAMVSLLASLLYLIGKMAETHWVTITQEVTGALLDLSNAFAGIGSIIAGVLASYGIYRCHVFADRLKGYKDPKEAIQYLLSAVTVSDAEKSALDNDPAKIEQRQKEKIEYVRARTSMKAVGMILDRAPALLEQFNAEDAQALIQDVVDEGTKKQLVYIVGLIATIFSFLSIALGSFTSMGSLPLVLMLAYIVIKVVLQYTNSRVEPNKEIPSRPPQIS